MEFLDRYRIWISTAVGLVIAMVVAGVVLSAPRELPAPAPAPTPALAENEVPLDTLFKDPRSGEEPDEQVLEFMGKLNEVNNYVTALDLVGTPEAREQYRQLWQYGLGLGLGMVAYDAEGKQLFDNADSADFAPLIELGAATLRTCLVDSRLIANNIAEDQITHTLIGSTCGSVADSLRTSKP